MGLEEENEKLGLLRSDLVVRGERGGGTENPAPGEVDGKNLSGRSVISVLSRNTKTPQNGSRQSDR